MRLSCDCCVNVCCQTQPPRMGVLLDGCWRIFTQLYLAPGGLTELEICALLGIEEGPLSIRWLRVRRAIKHLIFETAGLLRLAGGASSKTGEPRIQFQDFGNGFPRHRDHEDVAGVDPCA